MTVYDVFILGLLGSGMGVLWSIKAQIFNFLRRILFFNIQIVSNERCFYNVLTKVSQQIDNPRWISLRSKQGRGDNDSSIFCLGHGLHYVKLAGYRCIVNFSAEKMEHLLEYREILDIVAFRWARNSLLEEIKAASEQEPLKDGQMFLIRTDSYESNSLVVRGRNLTTIDITEDQELGTLEDAKWFFANEKWYDDRGIPYRRGHLYEGPPGNGKTSVARVLATELKRPLVYLNLSSVSSDTQLTNTLQRAPKGSIILIEDIDTFKITKSREEKKSKKSGPDLQVSVGSVTLGGLLNAIDGAVSLEGSLVILTTNKPDTLDPALIRPGRCDVRVYFGPPEKSQLESMYKRICQSTQKEAEDFANSNPDRFVSLAECQTYLQGLASQSIIKTQCKLRIKDCNKNGVLV